LVQGEELAATNRPNKGKVALALVEWLIVVMPVGGKVDGTKTSATEGKTKDKADIPVVGGEVYSTSSTGGNINVEAGATPAVGRMVEVAVVGGEVDSTSSTVGNINVKAGATPAVGLANVLPLALGGGPGAGWKRLPVPTKLAFLQGKE
jgi:hypothetical protein